MSKKFYSLFLTLLTAFLWLGSGTVWGADETLTVYESETATSAYVPVRGYDLDASQHNQFIIPASELEDVQGGTIKGIKFHLTAEATNSWSSGTAPSVTIKLAEVDQTTLSSLYSGSMTQVWNGTIVFTSDTWDIATFSTTFAYSNKNLLVDITTVANGWKNLTFLGKNADGASIAYNSQRNFIPRTTFTYTPAPTTCPKPGLSLDSKDATSAAFSWTQGGSETQWQYLCLRSKETLTDEHWNSAVLTSEDHVTIDTLQGNKTAYTFYLRAYCSGSDQSKVAKASFTTDCGGTISLPWSTSFEAADNCERNALPPCWSFLETSSYDADPTISGSDYSNYGYNTPNALRFGNYGSTSSTVVILPKFAEDIRNLRFIFYYKNGSTYSSRPQFKVGYITDPTDISTFVSVKDLTRYTSWTKDSIEFDAAESDGYIAVACAGGSNSAYGYLDDFVVKSLVDCGKPATPSASITSGTTATISWTANTGVTDYKYLNIDRTEDPSATLNWASATPVTGTSVDLTGLTDGHEYDFYLMCACGDTPSDACHYQPMGCPTPSNVVFSNETYNSITVSWTAGGGETSWNLEYQQGELGWVSVLDNPLTSTTYNLSGLITGVPYTVRVQAACGGGWASNTFTLAYGIPAPVVSGETDAQATVTWAAVTGADSYEYVVMPGTTDADWTSPEATDATSATLPGLTGGSSYTVYVRSVYGSSRSAAASAAITTTTIAPNTPTVDDYDDSSATLSWTNSGAATQYQWACKASGTPGDGDWSAATTATSVELTGLSGNTNYTFYVRSYYAEGKVSAYASKGFKTDCGTYPMPFAEAFNTSSVPACWDVSVHSDTYDAWGTTTAARVGTTGYSMQYYAPYTGSADMITPSIYLSEEANLRFYVKNYHATYGAVTGEVYIKTSSATTKIYDIPGTANAFELKEIDLTAYKDQTVKFIFRGYALGSGKYASIYVDSVSVKVIPCDKPAFAAANIVVGDASATISCAESKWNLKYRTNGVGDWTTISNITEASRTITGLTNGTTYEVQIQAVCSATRSSDWTASQTFTPASCPAVETVTLSAKTYNSVTVNWTTESPTNCDVQYQAEGDAAWTPAATDLEATSKNITGLSVGTKYYFQVKPNCSADGWAAAGETYTPAYGIPAPAVSGEAETQATVAWDAVYGATAYQYLVVTKDGDHSDWTGATDTNELSATLTGLTGGSNYDVWVRSNYSGNYSAEAKATFTTTKVAPTTLVKDAATTESITFSWSYTGAVNQFQWKTSKAGSEWSAVQSAKSATATGLEAGTTYTIYVRNYYADGIYSDVLSGSFNTECAVRNLEFSENFNAGVVPACWNADNKTSYGWETYLYTDETGSYCLRYNSRGSSGYYEQLATPSVYLSEKATLKFARKTTSTTPEFKVFISKDGGTNKEEIGSYSARTTKKTDSIVIADEYIGETVIFYFQGKSNGSSKYVYLDDVQVAYKYCAKPTNLAAAATTDGAVVTWTDDAEDGPWDLQYRVNGSSDAWTAVNSIAAKTYTLTSLIEQEYEVQVRTHASEHRISAWTASETFTPQCPNVTEVTFADGTYNSVTVNWTADGEATWSLRYKTTGDWTVINNIDAKTYPLTGLTTGETYTVAVKASCKSDEGWVAAATTYTPTYGVPTNVTISAIKDVTATLAWDAAAGATGYQYIVLEGDVAADWTAPQATTELSVDLSGLSAATTYSVYVRAAYGLNFGEATAKETFTTITYAPTGLAETAHAETSASFSWNHNAEGAATRYEYVALDGTDTPTGSTAWTLLDNNVTVATVEGLNPGAAYTFYVRSVYANNAKSDYASLAFSTECAVRNMPFSEDFESGVSPLCWSAMNGTTDYYDYDGSYGWKVKTGDASYVMRYTSGTGIIYPALVMPQINIEANAQLSFKVRNVLSSKTVNGKVVVSAEGVADLETTLTNSNSLTEQQIDLSAFAGKVATIKFVPTSNVSGGRIDLDDVRVFRGVTLVDNVNNTATLAGLVGQTLEVTLGRTIYCDGDFNTLCLPFSLPTLAGTPLAGGELWSFRYGEVVGGELQIRIAPATSIEAGVPYLITFANGADIVNPTFTDVTITKSVGVSVGQTDDVQFIGILKPQAFVEEDKNNLFVASNGMLAWSNVGTGTALSNLRSFRGYFHTETAVSGTPVANNMPARIVKEEQTATGCENIQDNTVTIKIIENNQVVIIRNGVKYTVQGQVISK